MSTLLLVSCDTACTKLLVASLPPFDEEVVNRYEVASLVASSSTKFAIEEPDGPLVAVAEKPVCVTE